MTKIFVGEIFISDFRDRRECLKNCFGEARHLTAEELALFQG
jgi:hypothetical protein